MIKRDLQHLIKAAAKKMPVITITGPRQSGKTTLAKLCFPKHLYQSLEDPENRLFANEDPRGFLEQFKNGGIIDEVQYAPQLFSYIQTISDASGKDGQFILTGSQNFLLLQKISQSLAGRVAVFNLLPFSFNELRKAKLLPEPYEKALIQGSYPRLYDKELAPKELYPSYISTYLERDVRQIINVQSLRSFQIFMKLCSGYAGQMLNIHALANETGVDSKTIKSWLSVLEASFLLFLLHPHYRNFNKRLVKTPKLYFYDTGILCSLLGIHTEAQLINYHNKGALFENLIIADVIKNRLNRAEQSGVYFWRNNAGNEVDLIVEQGTGLIPVEIKSGKTINEDYFKGLNYYKALADDASLKSYLLYGGNKKQKRGSGTVLPWDRTIDIQ